jgi:hypothetical protein
MSIVNHQGSCHLSVSKPLSMALPARRPGKCSSLPRTRRSPAHSPQSKSPSCCAKIPLTEVTPLKPHKSTGSTSLGECDRSSLALLGSEEGLLRRGLVLSAAARAAVTALSDRGASEAGHHRGSTTGNGTGVIVEDGDDVSPGKDHSEFEGEL